MQVRKQQLELDIEQQTGTKRKRSTSRLYIVTLLISLLCRVHHEKCWAGGNKLESRLLGENINNLRYADDTTLITERKEEIKSLLMKVREESGKAGLNLNIQKTKIMASGPTTTWQIDVVKLETVADFIFLGSKITTDSDCSHEIKTLAPCKNSYDKP